MADEKKAPDPVKLWDEQLKQYVNFDPSDVERAMSTDEGKRYMKDKPK